jgi:hypothetical protein
MAELVSEMPRKYPYFSAVTPPDKSWVAFVSSVEDMNVVGLFTERDQADLSAAVYLLDVIATAGRKVVNEGDRADFLEYVKKLNTVSSKIEGVLRRQKCDKLK